MKDVLLWRGNTICCLSFWFQDSMFWPATPYEAQAVVELCKDMVAWRSSHSPEIFPTNHQGHIQSCISPIQPSSWCSLFPEQSRTLFPALQRSLQKFFFLFCFFIFFLSFPFSANLVPTWATDTPSSPEPQTPKCLCVCGESADARTFSSCRREQPDHVPRALGWHTVFDSFLGLESSYSIGT